MIFKGYLFSVVYALICLALGFVLYKLGIAKKITRKLVHILVGFEWVILYYFMGAGWHFLSVCVAFFLLLAFSHRKNLMPMISSEGDNAPGTVYYGLAMSIMALITAFVPEMILPFGIGVFCTSVGDGFAGLLGQCVNTKWNIKVYKNKSIVGTAANFLCCFVVAFLFREIFNLPLSVLHCLAIAVFATQLELFTGRGLDNISITLGSAFLAYLFCFVQNSTNYILPILLTPLILIFAIEKKALTSDGIVSAIAVDVILTLMLGNFGFGLLLAFFVGGIATDKIKKKSKKTGQKVKKKSECRNSIQVLANSLAAVICSVLYFITGNKAFLIAFVASFAEALADTSASGVGALSRKAFDPFRMKSCPVGISGGMSVIGTCASAIGAILIALIAFASGVVSIWEASLVALGGFLGGVFDSLLGSLLQVKYKCTVCGTIVEKKQHCGKSTEKHSGLAFVNNDMVNLLGTIFAAVISYIIYIKFFM